jgi:hypothetical protein
MGQSIWKHIQSLGLQNKYVNDDIFRLSVNKLIGLAFVPVEDVGKAYSVMITGFDQDADGLLEYFERTWVGCKRTRGKYRVCVFSYDLKMIIYFRQSSNKTSICYRNVERI